MQAKPISQRGGSSLDWILGKSEKFLAAHNPSTHPPADGQTTALSQMIFHLPGHESATAPRRSHPPETDSCTLSTFTSARLPAERTAVLQVALSLAFRKGAEVF